MKLRYLFFAITFAAAALAQELPSAVSRSHMSSALAASVTPAPPTITISGRVVDKAGKPVSDAVVSLVPRTPETAVMTPVQPTWKTDAQGNFEINGVSPGSYVVQVKWNQGAKEYWAEQRVEATDNDITGLHLQLHGAQSLSGRVNAAGQTDFGFSRLVVRLSRQDDNSSSQTAEVAKDGTFTFAGLRPATYELQLIGLPDRWYLDTASLAGEDVFNQGVDLAQGTAGRKLDINVSPGAAEIDGFVIEQVYLDVVPHALVQLFPDPANPHRPDRLLTASTNSDGYFTIENVPPGRYHALAIMVRHRSEATVNTDSQNDARIARVAGTGVSVDKNQSKTLQLQLFEAHR